VKSTSGSYYETLDHVRAFAVFSVFTWHFIHVNYGQINGPAFFPLSQLYEGHTGVAIFMALTGYLFAKLLDNREVLWLPFIWNRVLRLGPLLSVVIVVFALVRVFEGRPLDYYFKSILEGFIFPTWPNGGWSITVELHFYFLLPLIWFLKSVIRQTLWLILLAMLMLSGCLYIERGDVQFVSYFTIMGRIDQFVLGILAFQNRAFFAGRHLFAVGVALAFAGFWWVFDSLGGFYRMPGNQPPTPLWIVIPTIEGAVYGSLIAWYDNSFALKSTRFSQFVASIGTCSYSMYLWHYFVVFRAARLIDRSVIGLTDPMVTIPMAALCFLLLQPFCYLSYTFIESPLLALRVKYLRPRM